MRIVDDIPPGWLIEISRTDLVGVRNALNELCNGTEFTAGDPELPTIVGFERNEIQELTDAINSSLAVRKNYRPAGNLVASASEDGSLLTLTLFPKDLWIIRAALKHAPYVFTSGVWHERGGGFQELKPGEVYPVEPGEIERRLGLSDERRQSLLGMIDSIVGDRRADEDLIYVRLPGESVDVLRPVTAQRRGGSTFKILDQPYDRNVERWEFEPREIVLCEPRRFEGEPVMVAVRRVEPD